MAICRSCISLLVSVPVLSENTYATCTTANPVNTVAASLCSCASRADAFKQYSALQLFLCE